MTRRFDALLSARETWLADEVRENLWNKDVAPEAYGTTSDAYRNAVLEQYKLYVEMADRVSGRRGLANTFFLTLNTAILALMGGLLHHHPHGMAIVLIFPLIGVLGQCVAWYWIVQSYRQLNSAKYAVVGALEERLPASPWWKAEWKLLGDGRDRSKYLPLSRLEQLIPVFFALLYLATYITIIVG